MSVHELVLFVAVDLEEEGEVSVGVRCRKFVCVVCCRCGELLDGLLMN